MKVSELIEMLEALDADSDAIVILAKDGEGNGFSPICEADAAHYIPFNKYSGECIHTDDVDDHPDAVSCVCLWPVN